jgi:hypothetical protein
MTAFMNEPWEDKKMICEPWPFPMRAITPLLHSAEAPNCDAFDVSAWDEALPRLIDFFVGVN